MNYEEGFVFICHSREGGNPEFFMTKYILHGGATRNKTESNKKFFFEMTNGLPNNLTILCVYFAKEKELWPQLFEEDKINFSSVAPGKTINFLLADEDTLAKQTKQADVIYLRGGNTKKLQISLGKVKNLNELLKDKVVAGSSAGALILSRYYYDNDSDTYNKGLGVLPIKTFCHYVEEKIDKLDQLKKYGEELKVYAIPEEKFIIIGQ